MQNFEPRGPGSPDSAVDHGRLCPWEPESADLWCLARGIENKEVVLWTSGRTSPSHPLREGSETYQLAGRQGKDAEHEMAGDLAMLLQLIRTEGAWRWVPARYANRMRKLPMLSGRGTAPISTDGSGCVAVQRRASCQHLPRSVARSMAAVRRAADVRKFSGPNLGKISSFRGFCKRLPFARANQFFFIAVPVLVMSSLRVS